MELTCKRCDRTWDYQGDSEWYTSCPRCKTTVKILKEEVVEEASSE